MSHDKAAIAKEVIRGVPNGLPPNAAERATKARLRSLGDQIGEPILSDPGEAPEHYVVVDLPPGFALKAVAMTPRAAERLLGSS